MTGGVMTVIVVILYAMGKIGYGWVVFGLLVDFCPYIFLAFCMLAGSIFDNPKQKK